MPQIDGVVAVGEVEGSPVLGGSAEVDGSAGGFTKV